MICRLSIVLVMIVYSTALWNDWWGHVFHQKEGKHSEFSTKFTQPWHDVKPWSSGQSRGRMRLFEVWKIHNIRHTQTGWDIICNLELYLYVLFFLFNWRLKGLWEGSNGESFNKGAPLRKGSIYLLSSWNEMFLF